MNYKILTRKNYILDSGLLQKGTTDVVIPFENMEVEVIDTFQLGDKVTLATEERMEALVNGSIAGSHKAIAGEYIVDTIQEAEDAINTYTTGGDLTLTNGRIFNNGNSVPGEVVYLIPTNQSSEWKSEELIVGSNKVIITLTNNNFTFKEFSVLENLIVDNAEEIKTKDTIANVDSKIAIEKNERENNIQSINATTSLLNTRITTNEQAIIRIDAVDATQNGRLQALEEAELIDDKTWEGSIAGADTVDLSSIVDQNGDTFDFTTGKRIEVVIEKVSASLEQAHDLITGATNATPYVIGTRQFTAKLSDAGILTLTETAANDLSNYNIVRVIEEKGTKTATVAYTKTESDTKFATKSELASIDLNGKQSTIDNSLQTSTKSVVGAINELKGTVDQTEQLVANLGSLKTTDGDDLSTTTETIVTDKTLTAKGYITKTEMDAAIAAALSTIMEVTFDDSSTGQFKLGK